MPGRMFVGIAQFVFLLRERRDPFTGGQVLDAISIYVPRREDDIRGAISTPPNWLFQFTSPQGGTTRGNQIALIVGVIFNPCLHKGGRHNQMLLDKATGAFQSTSPQGGDVCHLRGFAEFFEYFNPRPHKGDDASLLAISFIL